MDLADYDLPKVSPDALIIDVVEALAAKGMPFETEEQDIRGFPHQVFKHQPQSLTEAFAQFSAHGDKEFIVYGDERFTFTETLGKAAQIGQALVNDYGLQKGDRVALAMRNYPEWPMAYLGIIAAGGVAVLMNAWWGENELDFAMKDSGSKIAIADMPRAKLLASADPELKIIVARDAVAHGDVFAALDPLISGYDAAIWPSVDLGPDDYAMILYTSGSTGFPKGAVSDHRAILAVLFNWYCIVVALKLTGRNNPDPNFQPVMMVGVPFFHVTGLLPVMLVSALIGRKMVLLHKWDVEVALQAIEAEGVTNFTGVPTMSYELAVSPLLGKYDTSTLLDVGGGGAARPAEHVKMIADNLGCNPGIGYGLTETNAMAANCSGPEYLERPSTTGKPTPPMMFIKIINPDGTEVKQGERGEICIKSAVNTTCYWNNPEETAKSFIDGYFHTGDVAYQDQEGYLYIVDRIKDIIIRGGENVSTLEVESVLHGLPEVEDVMVFSLTCPRMGEIVGTAIVPTDKVFNEQKMLADASVNLAKFKLPERIWVRDEPLPLIASGKIDKTAVKEHYRALWQLELEGAS